MDSNIAAMIIGGVILLGLGIPCLASLCKMADEHTIKVRRDRKIKLAIDLIGQMAGRRLTAVRDVPVVLVGGGDSLLFCACCADRTGDGDAVERRRFGYVDIYTGDHGERPWMG